MKTRTENNKPPRSGAIRKGTMGQEEIKKVAKELTITCSHKSPRTSGPLQEVQAPAIDPVVKGDYNIIAEYIKAHCAIHDTFIATSEDLRKMIPQNKRATSIASNFEKIHGLSYRKTEGENNNDTYVFYVEPTREELMIELADKKAVIERRFNVSNKQEEEIDELKRDVVKAVIGGTIFGIYIARLYLHLNGL